MEGRELDREKEIKGCIHFWENALKEYALPPSPSVATLVRLTIKYLKETLELPNKGGAGK